MSLLSSPIHLNICIRFYILKVLSYNLDFSGKILLFFHLLQQNTELARSPGYSNSLFPGSVVHVCNPSTWESETG